MSTTEYALDIQERRGYDAPDDWVWLEHERAQVRIRRVLPDCETVWVGEARELARLFAEWLAEDKAKCNAAIQKIGEEFIDGMEADEVQA